MSIYAISDLHLSLGTNKPMDIFGWDNHVERIRANWCRLVKADDIVVLPGDFSWALKLEESLEDFKFLESLPGKKVLLKGNHDLWWPTVKKVMDFLNKNEITSVSLVFNNAYEYGDYCICGTRGWCFPEGGSDKKVILREVGRLKASLECAKKLNKKPLVFLHYPPVYGEEKCDEILDVLREYGIDFVYHGHIHGKGLNNATDEFGGIKFKLISSDCIDFTPYFIL